MTSRPGATGAGNLSSAAARVPMLGRYVLVEELDAGGMGSIYVALQKTITGVERPCVVKTVQRELLGHPDMRSRFLDEAKTSLMLMHKNICTTFDVDDVDGTILLAMERIAGRNLRHVLDSQMALEPDEVVDIAEQLLEGLEYAHAFADPRTGEPLHLVHRDISPKNVMIAFSGDVKIIDFGVSRGLLNETKTQAGVVVGKLRYLAPEQHAGARVDARADLVSVGIIVTELFSRKRYYGDLSGDGIERVLRSGSPYTSAALESVPRTMRPVLAAALARDPEDRFDGAAAFRESLRSAWGRPRQTGRLKHMMARLFPGADAEDRAHLQSLYAAAGFEKVTSSSSIAMPQLSQPSQPSQPSQSQRSQPLALSDDATQRSPVAPGDSGDPPSDSDRTVLTPYPTAGAPVSQVPALELPGGEETQPSPRAPFKIPSSDMSGDSASQRTVLITAPVPPVSVDVSGDLSGSLSSDLGGHVHSDSGRVVKLAGGNADNLLPPTDELPRPFPFAASTTGTIKNPVANDSTDSGPTRDLTNAPTAPSRPPAPASLAQGFPRGGPSGFGSPDDAADLTMPVPRHDRAQAKAQNAEVEVAASPRAAPQALRETPSSGTTPLVWLFVGITVAAAVSALLILVLR